MIHAVHDVDGNRIAEYEWDSVTQTSTLLREYVWMNGQAVAVIEGGQVYYIRTDHIGRPVFATNGAGVKVWEVSYLPFGGMHSSTGSVIGLRFPRQWLQSESGLHQNWMRDYDPSSSSPGLQRENSRSSFGAGKISNMKKRTIDKVRMAIEEKYRSRIDPDFSFVLTAIKLQPYRHLIETLETSFRICEISDPNDDVCFRYVLSNSKREWLLELSMIGPFATLFRMGKDGRVSFLSSETTANEKTILGALADERIKLLQQSFLEMPIFINLQNTCGDNARIYQALFSDTDVLPWC